MRGSVISTAWDLTGTGSAVAGYDPKNFVARNNAAATACLLKINLTKAHETAREVYALHPEEPIVASTYAHSLHLQRRTKAGLAVMEKLRGEELERTPVALYYGLLLAADGEAAKARKYLEISRTSSLLPEEKELFAAATRNL